jgi:tetratricopeptide (TPR) repeat protein
MDVQLLFSRRKKLVAGLMAACAVSAGCALKSPEPVQPNTRPPDYRAARDALTRKEFAHAANSLREQIARDPSPPVEAHLALALACTNVGSYAESTEAALRAVGEMHDRRAMPAACYLLFLNALRSGDSDRAHRTLAAAARRAEKLSAVEAERPRDRSQRESRGAAVAHMARGRRALVAGSKTRALGEYSAALELWADSPCIKLCICECLRQVGDPQSAAGFLRTALKTLTRRREWREPLIEACVQALVVPPAVLEITAPGS